MPNYKKAMVIIKLKETHSHVTSEQKELTNHDYKLPVANLEDLPQFTG